MHPHPSPRVPPATSLPTSLPTSLLVSGSLLLAACGGGDNGTDPAPTTPSDTFAFVATATPVTRDAGQIERLSLGEEIVPSGTTAATGSDIAVATDGRDVYAIGRFQIDSLTRYSPDDLATPLWQYSVNGDETASNPYDIVFASETKAYVIRYGSPFVWIVDPTASDETSFKTGQIDLGAYDPNDGVPNMSDAVLVDGKLFVLMQRLDETASFAPTLDGYVAVIDTATDTEIDTGMGESGLKGIALGTSNPEGLSYLEASDEIYVVGRGNIYANEGAPGDPYDGGIETVDPESFAHALLLDDGTAEDNRGFVADALVVSPAKGYVLYYSGFGITTLRAFNPVTGMLADGVVAGLEDRDITTLAEAPDGRIWVGLNGDTARGFTVLDPADDSVSIADVPTELDPIDIVFVEVPATGGN